MEDTFTNLPSSTFPMVKFHTYQLSSLKPVPPHPPYPSSLSLSRSFFPCFLLFFFIFYELMPPPSLPSTSISSYLFIRLGYLFWRKKLTLLPLVLPLQLLMAMLSMMYPLLRSMDTNTRHVESKVRGDDNRIYREYVKMIRESACLHT